MKKSSYYTLTLTNSRTARGILSMPVFLSILTFRLEIDSILKKIIRLLISILKIIINNLKRNPMTIIKIRKMIMRKRKCRRRNQMKKYKMNCLRNRKKKMNKKNKWKFLRRKLIMDWDLIELVRKFKNSIIIRRIRSCHSKKTRSLNRNPVWTKITSMHSILITVRKKNEIHNVLFCLTSKKKRQNDWF